MALGGRAKSLPLIPKRAIPALRCQSVPPSLDFQDQSVLTTTASMVVKSPRRVLRLADFAQDALNLPKHSPTNARIRMDVRSVHKAPPTTPHPTPSSILTFAKYRSHLEFIGNLIFNSSNNQLIN